MSNVAAAENAGSEILIDTREVKDEIALIWRIANFSKIHEKHNLQAQFSLSRNSTTWKIKLHKACIELQRSDMGEVVYCDIEVSLATLSKTYSKTYKSHRFHKSENFFSLLDFDHNYQYDFRQRREPFEFQDDVFKLRFNMKISGPVVNEIIQSSDYLKPNFEKLIEDFGNMLNRNQHCDVTISTGIYKLPVHKAVLCARSKEFDRMFQSDAKGNKIQVIELQDFDFNTVKDFVAFLYTGKIEELSTEKAKNLYHIASKYNVTDLRGKCAFYLEFNLCVDEACSILKLAELHKDIKLKNAVIIFIQMHVSAVKETYGWKDLVKQQPDLALQILK